MRKMFANIREVHGLRICSRIFDDSKKDCELKKMEKISKIKTTTRHQVHNKIYDPTERHWAENYSHSPAKSMNNKTKLHWAEN